MHEVVTIQLGQQANYIGSHYWNVQESYFTYAGQDASPVDHDISFRPGIGANGIDTYTPRALIYDLKGAFGTLRRHNALYEIQGSASELSPWQGDITSLRLPLIAPSSYQEALDQGLEPPKLSTSTVRYWSDYNRVFYHPRSIVQLNEYELNSSLMPFERWETGTELFAALDREHDLLDRDLRPFLEECDQLQAIQVFAGINDAWGGFASKYLERIADETGKGCRWVFGLEESKRGGRDRQAIQTANYAQSLYALDASASLLVPISNVPKTLPGYLAMDTSSRWHTAALQAMAIESVTLPTRLQASQSQNRNLFTNLEATLNNDGKRRIAACSLSAQKPNPAVNGDSSMSNGHQDPRMSNGHRSPPVNTRTTTNDSFSTEIPLYPTSTAPSRRHSPPRAQIFSLIQTLRTPQTQDPPINQISLSDDDPNPLHQSTCETPLLFPLLSSYPEIIDPDSQDHEVACKTSLVTSNAIAHSVRDVEALARRIVGIEEREALCDGLAAMAEEYEEGWVSDDEGSEDDE